MRRPALINTLVSNMTPEWQLLICCARFRLSEQGSQQIKELLKREVDWQSFIETAEIHRILPLVYLHLSKGYEDVIPQAVLFELQYRFTENTKRNLRLTGRLFKFLDMCRANSIFALPYKGPVLAVYLYGDVAMRQFCDLDILVRREDFPRVRELLISSGYEPQFNLTPRQELSLLKFRHEHCFQHPMDECSVDVHWSLTPRYFALNLERESLDGLPESVAVGERHLQTLAVEDLVLLLSIHGAQHRWERLSWLCDLAELLKARSDLNWEHLLGRARAHGFERMVLLGLYLAHTLLDAPLPPLLLERAEADGSIKTLADKTVRDLFREKGQILFHDHIFYIKSLEGVRRKFRYCFDQIFTPTPLEWEFLALPSSLSFLYYLVRPVRLAVKYALGAARLGTAANHEAKPVHEA